MKKTSTLKVEYQNKPPASVAWGIHPSPAGKLLIGVTPSGSICRVNFVASRSTADTIKIWQKEWPRTSFIRSDEQTARAAKKLFDTPLLMTGTDFQHKVWKGMLAIPHGETVSYGTLAKRIKNPKAARAVGSACGKNPVAFLVPCHRVIANDGGIGGFSSGLGIKRELLEMEAKPKKKA